MNRQQFKETLEKLELRKPRTVEVLRRLLAGDTDAQIALLRGRNKGTVRKQISKIYQDFGIKGKFTGDRQSRRKELIALFHEYHPEWVHDCFPAFTNEVSDGGKKVSQNGLPQPVSSSTKEGERGEELMSLATSMLEQLGFNQKFRVNTTSQYIGYRLKNPREGSKHYQLILAQRPKYLSISIHKDFLELEVLQLKIYVYGNHWDAAMSAIVTPFILGKIWVLPSKEDVFLESMQFQYPNILRGEVVGEFVLNYWDDKVDRWDDSIVSEKITIKNLSDKDSYLIVQENELFPYTGEVCISSREILKEFIDNFGLIIMKK
ncbi:hypothetical protein H6F61_25915 [Cyanobacteria bacterium FACHB-472]|nr:hypothetical protein [Cyanobacteria bacterium FACHB-472]